MFGRRKTRVAPPTRHEMKCGGETVTFLWVRGTGRRLRLEVGPDGAVRVHSPARAGDGQVTAFVAGKADWIARMREKARARVRLEWPAASRDRARLRKEAERSLRARLEACLPAAAVCGFVSGSVPPPVSFRLMKRRWGSCGRDGRVVLNVRLAQLPEACVDYVIFHELCHLRHHHHGRAFYERLARAVPDWKERRKELDRYLLI